MKEQYDKYLPIGTVVLLKKAKKRIMITGYGAKTDGNPGKLWDYVGCLYPEGMISSNKNLLFDHENISDVYALGYSDDEQVRFMKFFKESLNVKKDFE